MQGDFLAALEACAVASIREALSRQGLPPVTAREQAEDTARTIVDRMLMEWAGQQVYIPIRHPRRDDMIMADFTGNNVPELARKYHLSVRTIHKIVARKTREARDQAARRQHRLPGM